jgi:hypothetical protein
MRRYLWLAFLIYGSAWAGEITVQPLKGSTFIQKSDSAWDELHAPRQVPAGTQVRTGDASSAFLILPGDHRVAVGPDTTLNLQQASEGETKLFLRSGSIRNKVRKLRRELGQSYKIQTPTIVVAVRGTDFSVVQDRKARVAVFEGQVDLSALRKDIALETAHLTAGQSASLDGAGKVEAGALPAGPARSEPESQPAPETQKPKPSDKDDSREGPRGPPPPPPPSGGLWWDHPEATQPSGFFDPSDDAALLKPRPPERPPFRDERTLSGPAPGDTLLNPLPPPGNTGNTSPTAAGLEALVDTLRSQNLQDQANSVLVADLFQRNAVRMDPLTGQLRQYADAILTNGPDAIKFVNANMIPGRPETLNYATMITKFNTTLPSFYTDATKTAFQSPGTTAPSYYATEYHADISNTVDHLRIDATGGVSALDAFNSRYVTKFNDRKTEINGTTLWSETSGVMTYRGGSAPAGFQNATGIADHEVGERYATGDFFSIRTTFSDDNGRIVSAADRPGSLTPSQYLDTLTVRTTIRSNLLQKGSLDLFGSVTARVLSGAYWINDSQASQILNGNIIPIGAPNGLAL